jgi:hypothetical protein
MQTETVIWSGSVWSGHTFLSLTCAIAFPIVFGVWTYLERHKSTAIQRRVLWFFFGAMWLLMTITTWHQIFWATPASTVGQLKLVQDRAGRNTVGHMTLLTKDGERKIRLSHVRGGIGDKLVIGECYRAEYVNALGNYIELIAITQLHTDNCLT